MKKWLLVVLILGMGLVGPVLPAANDPVALRSINQMLASLSHIRTLSCDVEVQHLLPTGKKAIAYQLYVDQTGQQAAIFKSPIRRAFIQNKKGNYRVENGEARRLPKGAGFPFDVPSQLFRGLALKDVTDNYTFIVNQRTPDMIVIDMIPIGTGGQSIDAAYRSDAISQLRFSIALPLHTLRKVEIFKHNQSIATDWVEIWYDIIPSTTKRPDAKAIMVSKTQSVRRASKSNATQVNEIKTVWYRNCRLNEGVPSDVFDEENY